jgi:tRNA A37 threonylcarbamoyladenosine dehydratase
MQLPLTVDTRQKPLSPAAAADAPDRAEPETDAAEPETQYRTHRRFDRAARLFSEPGLHRLMQARVLVIGVGGVGSFAAEALARSGVGQLELIDFDKVCVTNTNRQLHAMKGTVGRRKVEVMAERLSLVHPTSKVSAIAQFYNKDSSAELLSGHIDFVVDAIDNLTAKAHLLATCLERNIPVVSSMGAAARLDPTAIRVEDLSETSKDPFARALRKILRDNHGVQIERGAPVGIHAVFSLEEPRAPSPLAYDEGTGFRCVCPGGKNGLHDCDRRARIDGTAAFVTGSFGLTAASVVVRRLIERTATRA